MKPVVAIAGALFILVLAAVAGFVAHQWLNPPATTSVRDQGIVVRDEVLGMQRPDFSLPDLHGASRALSEWDGKVIVLNFWATWCPPCRDEIPVFMALQAEFADQGLQFLGIALQDANEVREYVAETGINYPILTGYREVIKIASALGNHMGALPYTVIINRDGRVEFIKAGPLDAETARTAVLNYL